MKPLITFVYPYYDNPEMYKLQQLNWCSYPKWIQDNLAVIVTDDCSPRWPLSDVEKTFNNQRRFKILKDIRWNWLAARNIGAHYAHDDSWLFLTDIDHLIPASTIGALMAKIKDGLLSKDFFYKFSRCDAPDLTPYKDHPNTYFMHRSLYWKIGGYDEYYSGNYGTDGMYRRKAESTAKGFERFDNLYVVRYPREVVPDASTTTLKRKEGRDPKKLKKMKAEKDASGKIKPVVLSFPYEEIN